MQAGGPPEAAGGALVNLEQLADLGLRPAVIERQPHNFALVGRQLVKGLVKTAPGVLALNQAKTARVFLENNKKT